MSPVEQRRAEWSYQPAGNLPGTISQHPAAGMDPASGPGLEEGPRWCPQLLFVVVERWSTHSRHPPDRPPCSELRLAQWDRTKLHKHKHVQSFRDTTWQQSHLSICEPRTLWGLLFFSLYSPSETPQFGVCVGWTLHPGGVKLSGGGRRWCISFIVLL